MVTIWFYYFYRAKKYARLILKIIYENKKYIYNILIKEKMTDVIYLVFCLDREGEVIARN